MNDSSNNFESTFLAQLHAGRWKPGDRLPTTAELAKESGSDLRSVQRTLAALAARGLLDRRPRHGTFIKANPTPPPIGLLTGWNLKLERNAWPRAFAQAIDDALTANGYRLHLFDDLFALMQNDETIWQNGVARLREEFERVQPVGFVELQVHLSRLAPLAQEWQRPTIHCGRKEHGSDAAFHRPAFYRDSLQWLAERGSRRVLLIRKGALLEHYPDEDEAYREAAQAYQFLRADLREIYVREQNPDIEAAAATLMESLLAQWQTSRKTELPDALLVTDDLIMRGITTALLRQPSPQPLTLLTLATENLPHTFPLPVVRYEYPLPALAREIVHRLHLKLSRHPQPKQPALFSGTIITPESSPLPLPAEPLFQL